VYVLKTALPLDIRDWQSEQETSPYWPP